MATFNDLIKTGKVKATFLRRNAILNDMYEKVLSIERLDRVTPNVRTFERQEVSANKSLEELKLIKRELYILLEDANQDIKDDQEYIADQKLVIDNEFALINAIDEYVQLLHSKDIEYPPEVKPVTGSVDLSDVLNNLIASQNSLAASQNKNAITQDRILSTLDKNLTDVVASQNKNLTDVVASQNQNVADLSKSLVDQIKSHTASSKTGPKALQPKFKPKGNDSDFAEFSSFLSKFEFFIAKCSTNVEKLQWLQTSVEGEAVGLIKHFSLVEDNYAIALKKLTDRYSNPDVVKHMLFQSILSFKCEAGTKFSKTQSAMTAFSNTLDELRTVHNLPIGDLLCKELLREICFYNLPSEVRKGLIEETNNNYPPIAEIITKLDKVITKLNITGCSSSSSKSNSQSNVTNSNLNGITTLNVNHSMPNASNKKTKVNKCLFCGNSGHYFWKCTQVKTKDERLKILKDKIS